MKTFIQVQTNGNELNIADVEKAVREDLKAQGIKTTLITTLNLYVKPLENETYFVAHLKDGREINAKINN